MSPDGRLVAAARLDGTVRVWDVETGQDAFPSTPAPPSGTPYMTWPGAPTATFSPSPPTTARRGASTIVDRSGREVAVLADGTGIAVGVVAFSPDGEQLISTRLPTDDPDPAPARS